MRTLRDVGDVKPELVALSDDVWARTRARVDGLIDEEHRWEPAPGCWSIRPRVDGDWTVDHVLPAPDSAVSVRGHRQDGSTSPSIDTDEVNEMALRPELDHDGYREALFASMCDQGYGVAGDEDLADAVDELITAVQMLGAVVGDGTVVERSGPRLTVRRPGTRRAP